MPAPHVRQIKVSCQEWYAAYIDQCCAQDADIHDPVPCDNLKSHHDQFVNDEHGEADADHPVRVSINKKLAAPLYDTALVDRDSYPHEESAVAERLAQRQFLVKLGIQVR